MADVNRARIVQALYEMGPLSRADLARLTGFSRATIGTVVQGMLAAGILAEGETRPSSAAGGKPSRPLWFAPDARPIVAVHLLPGTIDAAVISAGGTIRSRVHREFDIRAPKGADALRAVVSALRELLADISSPPIGVGIAVSGMVDTDSGTIVKIALAPDLDGLAIGPLVAEEFDLPVWIDLHPRVQALGDRWFGQGRGHRTFASLYTGETLGIGLIIGGVVQRGVAGDGGEIGHMTVHMDGVVCRCGRTGCWETVATHSWLRAEAMRLGLTGAATMTAGPLVRLAARGDGDASDLLDRYARNIAIGIANLHHIVAPGLFILHGDTVAGGELLRHRIEHHVHTALLPHPAGPPRIAFTTLHDDAALLGSAGLVLSYSMEH
ncbi:MAG TPA: ROK family protein [Mycobacteriales bacterium]|nr:ROK family protein [Mycobacteriales bacterium]